MAKKASAGKSTNSNTKTSEDALLEKARTAGAKDARSSLDSGDYGYHASTKGLSTLTLIDDMWSFAKDKVIGRAKIDARVVTALAKEYRKSWRAAIDAERHPPKPATWTIERGRLDLQSLGKVPSDIEGLTIVRELSLYGMRLPKLPPVVFSLPNVATAYLQRNKLTKIPSSIDQWKKLRVLHLGDNPLVDADAICALTGLRALDLSGSKLKALPADIGELRNLEVIDLFQAKSSWKELPESFFQLKKLKSMRVPLNMGASVSAQLKAAKMKVRVVTGGNVMP